MDQLIPSLALVLAPLAVAFRSEVYSSFCLTVVAWIVCLGRRTLSRVWETIGHTEQRNHAAAYRLFSAAVWNWDEVCRLLLLRVLALVPGVRLWVVVDDTLAHKRGAKVAFGARETHFKVCRISTLARGLREDHSWSRKDSPG